MPARLPAAALLAFLKHWRLRGCATAPCALPPQVASSPPVISPTAVLPLPFACRAGAATPRPGGLARKSSARPHNKEGSNRGQRRVSIGGVETLAGAPRPQMSGAVATEQPDAKEADVEKELEDELAMEGGAPSFLEPGSALQQ